MNLCCLDRLLPTPTSLCKLTFVLIITEAVVGSSCPTRRPNRECRPRSEQPAKCSRRHKYRPWYDSRPTHISIVSGLQLVSDLKFRPSVFNTHLWPQRGADCFVVSFVNECNVETGNGCTHYSNKCKVVWKKQRIDHSDPRWKDQTLIIHSAQNLDVLPPL